jgi:predicted O-linked N-acetylglucosamine transferase (SPINDLY family)
MNPFSSLTEAFAQALHYHRSAQLHHAETIYWQILTANPNHADSWHLLGEIALRRGQNEVGIDYISRAITFDPRLAHFHNNLGAAYERTGQFEEATASYQQALQVNPDFAPAYQNLSAILGKQGKVAEAEAHARNAVRLEPRSAEARNNLGLALLEQKKAREAVACFQEALRLQPALSSAHCNLGNALLGMGRTAEALASYREAVQLEPRDAASHYNMAFALLECGETAHAEAAFRQTIGLKADFPGAHNNLALSLIEQGRLGEASAAYQEAMRIDPHDCRAHSNYLFFLSFLPGLDGDRLFEEHRRWAVLHANPVDRYPAERPTPRPGPLRVGYVSPALHWNAIAYFLEPILANHDPEVVRSVCYADVATPDDMTQRLRALSRSWRSTCGLSDIQVAEMVRNDGIDILVDLAGHTGSNRLGVFARKPSPVQVTYLGYPATTGLGTIDYRLTDVEADPPGGPSRYTEELVRLPGCFCCYQPPTELVVNELPATLTGRLTFGSLHGLAKVNGAVLDLWSAVLRTVPSARLLIVRNTICERVRERLASEFVARGVPPDRYELRRLTGGHNAQFGVYREIDVTFDVFPFGGHTTACESLWMGVPVITLRGNSCAGRMVSSVLTCLGQEEFIAATPAAYVELASRLAGELPRLAALRSQLRELMRKSPLCDGRGFTRRLESVYRALWDRACGAR